MMKRTKGFAALIAVIMVIMIPLSAFAEIQFYAPYTYKVTTTGGVPTVFSSHAYAMDYIAYVFAPQEVSFERDTDGITLQPKFLTLQDKTTGETVKKYDAAHPAVTVDKGQLHINQNKRPGISKNRLSVKMKLAFRFIAGEFVYEVTDAVNAAADADKEALYDYTLTENETTQYYKKAPTYWRYKNGTEYLAACAAVAAGNSQPGPDSYRFQRYVIPLLFNAEGRSYTIYINSENNALYNSGNVSFTLKSMDALGNIKDIRTGTVAANGTHDIDLPRNGSELLYDVTLSVDKESEKMCFKIEEVSATGDIIRVICDETYVGTEEYNTNTETMNHFDTNRNSNTQENRATIAAEVTAFSNTQGLYPAVSRDSLSPSKTCIAANYSDQALRVRGVEYTSEAYAFDGIPEIKNENGSYTTVVKVANNLYNDVAVASNSEKAPMVVLACYDDNGILIDADVKGDEAFGSIRGSAAALLTDDNYNTYNMSVSSEGATRAKLFIWHGNTLAPVYSAIASKN